MTTAAVKESQWSCSIIHSVQSGFGRRGLCLNDIIIIIISSVDQQKKTKKKQLGHSYSTLLKSSAELGSTLGEIIFSEFQSP